MNVLYLDWSCFGTTQMVKAMSDLGFGVLKFFHEDYDKRSSDEFLLAAKAACEGKNIDFCFSFNFYPLMAKFCYENGLKYVSLVYDSPLTNLYSYTVTYETNYIFLFDSDIVDYFNSEGINTFRYACLPSNLRAMDEYRPTNNFVVKSYGGDVSFVGALYNEQHNFYDRLKTLSPHTRGYVDGLMRAQSFIYGQNFIASCLPESIINEFQNEVNYIPTPDCAVPLSYIFSEYYINRKLTSIERIDLLTAVAEKFNLNLYTFPGSDIIPNAKFMGPVGYNTEMPLVFRDSKINLNISLRSIKSGIPLRCMDIMACGGFLLTNYQADFFRHFEAGVDYDYYESKEDMLDKIAYYLDHDSERRRIARSGMEKVRENHSCEKFLKDMMHVVF